MKRTFIYTDAKSNKFWSIELTDDAKTYTVTYGKVETTGQTVSKSFPDATACKKAVDKLIAEKTGKGYVEQTAESKASQSKQATAKPAEVAKVAAPTTPANPGEPARPANVPATARWRADSKTWVDFDKINNPNGLGDVRNWTEDGVLYEFTSFKRGNGFTLIHYHRDGTIAQQAEHKGPMATNHGTFINQRSENPTFNYKFLIDVPEVWKIVRTFKDGERTSSIFYDKAGNQLDREKILATIQPKTAAPTAQPSPTKTIKLEQSDLKPWPKGTTAKVVTYNEALALMPACKPKYGKMDAYALVLSGNIHIKGNLRLDEIYLGRYSAIIIQGDLTVEGLLQHASGESSEPVLAITGSLSAQNFIYGQTDIIIGGSLSISGIILGFWDGTLAVQGKISTPAIYAPDHSIESAGKEAKKINFLSENDFMSDFLDDDDQLDIGKVTKALSKNKAILEK